MGATAVALGLPSQGARGKFKGATKGTSIASRILSKKFPRKLSRAIILPPTLKNPRATSAVVGRIAGRWVPIVGWGLLAYDAVSIANCMKKCMDEPCSN